MVFFIVLAGHGLDSPIFSTPLSLLTWLSKVGDVLFVNQNKVVSQNFKLYRTIVFGISSCSCDHHSVSCLTRVQFANSKFQSHPLKFIPVQLNRAPCDAYKFRFWPRTIKLCLRHLIFYNIDSIDNFELAANAVFHLIWLPPLAFNSLFLITYSFIFRKLATCSHTDIVIHICRCRVRCNVFCMGV